MIRRLSVILLLAMALSCSEENIKDRCEQYFIHQVKDGFPITLYYNSNRLLSTIIADLDGFRSDYIYDDAHNLIEVRRDVGRTEFRYNDEGKLIATLRFWESTAIDSMAVFYDESGRIIKREIHKGPSNNSIFQSYVSISYPTNETVEVDFYNNDGSDFKFSGNFTYVLDGKRRPYPNEYYLDYLSASNIILNSNPISLSIYNSNSILISNESYEYTYNSDGYPIGLNGGSQFKYVCEPPQE